MFKITYTFVLEPRGKEKWKKKSKLNCYMLKEIRFLLEVGDLMNTFVKREA